MDLELSQVRPGDKGFRARERGGQLDQYQTLLDQFIQFIRENARFLPVTSRLGQEAADATQSFAQYLTVQLQSLRDVDRTDDSAVARWYRGQAFLPLLRVFLQTVTMHHWWRIVRACQKDNDAAECDHMRAFVDQNLEEQSSMGLFSSSSTCLVDLKGQPCTEEWQRANEILTKELRRLDSLFQSLSRRSLKERVAGSGLPSRGTVEPQGSQQLMVSIMDVVGDFNRSFMQTLEGLMPGLLDSERDRLDSERKMLEETQVRLTEQVAAAQRDIQRALAERRELPDVAELFQPIQLQLENATRQLEQSQQEFQARIQAREEELRREYDLAQTQLVASLLAQMSAQQRQIEALQEQAAQVPSKLEEDFRQLSQRTEEALGKYAASFRHLQAQVSDVASGQEQRVRAYTDESVTSLESRVSGQLARLTETLYGESRRLVEALGERIMQQTSLARAYDDRQLRAGMAHTNQLLQSLTAAFRQESQKSYEERYTADRELRERVLSLESQMAQWRAAQSSLLRASSLVLSIMTLLIFVYMQWMEWLPVSEYEYTRVT